MPTNNQNSNTNTKKRMNLPNQLSILRLVLIPVFIACFYWEFPHHYLVATLVFTASAFTDFLDGYLARKLNLVTDLGKFLDSSADKVLVLSALVIICDGDLLPNIYGGIGVTIILAREILISCLRMVAASKGLVLSADKFGKLKTLFQDLTIIFILITAQLIGSNAEFAFYLTSNILFGISLALTIFSGLNYFYKNRKTLAKIDK